MPDLPSRWVGTPDRSRSAGAGSKGGAVARSVAAPARKTVPPRGNSRTGAPGARAIGSNTQSRRISLASVRVRSRALPGVHRSEHVVGHRLQLGVVGADLGGTSLVPADPDARLLIGGYLGEVLEDAAGAGQPGDGVQGAVGGGHRQAAGVLTHRRGDVGVLLGRGGLVVLPHPGQPDAVVQAVVDVVVGAHRVRQRVQDAEEPAGEGHRGGVLRQTMFDMACARVSKPV